jgi:DNA-binding GntR family transcriptional regulator
MGAEAVSVSSERAYAHIKAAILNGRYGSGARLPEDKMASEIGVSRTPIRDALRRLQVEQLVVVTPYSGARVASWSEFELRETVKVRAMLEAFAARLAAERRSEAQLAAMGTLCDGMEAEAARSEPDMERLTVGNVAFHRLVAEAGGNARIIGWLEPIWSLPMIARRPERGRPGSLALSHAHHREILTAIAGQDGDWAEAVMRSHVLASRGPYMAFAREE